MRDLALRSRPEIDRWGDDGGTTFRESPRSFFLSWIKYCCTAVNGNYIHQRIKGLQHPVGLEVLCLLLNYMLDGDIDAGIPAGVSVGLRACVHR